MERRATDRQTDTVGSRRIATYSVILSARQESKSQEESIRVNAISGVGGASVQNPASCIVPSTTVTLDNYDHKSFHSQR